MTENNLTLKELRAYRNLQDEPFDFGDGLIYPESNESKDAIYEMDIQNLEEYEYDIKYEHRNKSEISQYELDLTRKSKVLHKRELNSKHKKKYKKRIKDKAILKSLSNRKIRRCNLNYKINKGGEYKKIYENIKSRINRWWF